MRRPRDGTCVAGSFSFFGNPDADSCAGAERFFITITCLQVYPDECVLKVMGFGLLEVVYIGLIYASLS